jgi:hypothetical protein
MPVSARVEKFRRHFDKEVFKIGEWVMVKRVGVETQKNSKFKLR